MTVFIYVVNIYTCNNHMNKLYTNVYLLLTIIVLAFIHADYQYNINFFFKLLKTIVFLITNSSHMIITKINIIWYKYATTRQNMLVILQK